VADGRHEARRSIAAWKVAKYERQIAAAIAAAFLIHRKAVLALGLKPGTPPPDPFDLAGFANTAETVTEPRVRAVLTEIIDDVAKTAGVQGGSAYLLGLKPGADGGSVANSLNEATGGIMKKTNALADRVSQRVSLTISTATDEGKLAASMNSLFDAADIQSSYVARSANFFANALSTQAALTVQGAGQAMQKTWTTMGDSKVREDHLEVDGTTIPVDQSFTVGGEDLMYPGDPNGSEAEVANCRCWLVMEPAPTATAAAADPPPDVLAAAGISPFKGDPGHTVSVGKLGGFEVVIRAGGYQGPNREARRLQAKKARRKR
jgi:hypothetical protein